MGFLTTFRRGVRVSEHLLTGGAIALALSAGRRFGWRPVWLPAVVRWWHRRLCRGLELKVRVTGELAERALLVANHISWLDLIRHELQLPPGSSPAPAPISAAASAGGKFGSFGAPRYRLSSRKEGLAEACA
jgi:hypothetical protein